MKDGKHSTHSQLHRSGGVRFKVPGKNIVAPTSRSSVSPVCARQLRDYSSGLGQFAPPADGVRNTTAGQSNLVAQVFNRRVADLHSPHGLRAAKLLGRFTAQCRKFQRRTNRSRLKRWGNSSGSTGIVSRQSALTQAALLNRHPSWRVNEFANTVGLLHPLHMTIALKRKAEAFVTRLKPEDRVEVADMLHASLPRAYENGVERAWEKEIDRRLDECESGKSEALPSRQVHAAVRRRLNEIKVRRVSSRRAACSRRSCGVV